MEPGKRYSFAVQAGNPAGPSPLSTVTYHAVPRLDDDWGHLGSAGGAPPAELSEAERRVHRARNTLHRAVKEYSDVGVAREALRELRALHNAGEAVVSDLRRCEEKVDELAAREAARAEERHLAAERRKQEQLHKEAKQQQEKEAKDREAAELERRRLEKLRAKGAKREARAAGKERAAREAADKLVALYRCALDRAEVRANSTRPCACAPGVFAAAARQIKNDRTGNPHVTLRRHAGALLLAGTPPEREGRVDTRRNTGDPKGPA